ncbi:MAG TPA: hypothetical protein IAA35_04005 [Candidatus Alistipes faecigallinarum]|nr:hypothetical protein [Candidatus Alistipes faecigallinarum]
MKKLFLVAALFLAAGTAAWAAQDATMSPAVQIAADDFSPIDVKDLPTAVAEAVESNFPGSSISEAAVRTAADGVKTFRISLTDRDGAKRTALFSESGELLPSGAPMPASEQEQDLPCTDEVLD